MIRSVFFASALFLAALLSSASAQTRVIIPCPSGVPCFIDVPGHIDAFGTARLPWVVSVATPSGVCLSVAKNTSDGPVIRSAIAPDGAVYRTLDGTPIIVRPTKAGWYTIQLDTPPPGREQIFNFRFQLSAAASCNTGTPPR